MVGGRWRVHQSYWFYQIGSIISVVTGTEITAGETRSETYINYVGKAVTHSLYETKKYNVIKGQIFKINGKCKGTNDVACYAFYNDIEISPNKLVYIYNITDFVGEEYDRAQEAVIDYFVDMSDGVVMVANRKNEDKSYVFDGILMFVADKGCLNEARMVFINKLIEQKVGK